MEIMAAIGKKSSFNEAFSADRPRAGAAPPLGTKGLD
jgi:hypothetical protein